MNDIRHILKDTKNSFYQMSLLSAYEKKEALEVFANLIAQNESLLIDANKTDMKLAHEKSLDPQLLNRLELSRAKLSQVIQGVRDLAKMSDPVGTELDSTTLDNDLTLTKRAVPIGVIGVIFESRPDVIPQILSLILKSSNVTILKGGSEALETNRAFMKVVDQLNKQCPALPDHWATLLESREDIKELLKYDKDIDLMIPRGSNQLVQFVMSHTNIPVLGHADGICHIYLDEHFDLNNYRQVIVDSKTQYPSACNALETLLIHKSHLNTSEAKDLVRHLLSHGVQLNGCEVAQNLNPNIRPCNNWAVEYGDTTLSVKIVTSVDEAIEHINTYGSGHTDCIITSDVEKRDRFFKMVDSASVFCNASTRFADGFRYGFGAEVGISTAKTHARGPVGLDGLLIYKYELVGSGQIVASYTGDNARQFLHKKNK